MFKAFNSFQIVGLFAAAPFGVGWLRQAEFSGSGAAFWCSLIIYMLFFIFMCVAVWNAIDAD